LRRPETQSRDAGPLIAGILLAAGQSTRFGRQKLLERWDGEPLVRRAARALVDARLSPVVVVVSSDPAYHAALAGLRLTTVTNHEPEQGISRSIAVGLRALPATAEAALIGVADQPNLGAAAVAALIGAFDRGAIVIARYDDHRGNPAVFDRRFFPELLALEGDRGGQAVVNTHPEAVVEVTLPQAAGEDVDRPEQWRG
jgi:molybdenum cofactor cytidylyltransferase